MMIVFFRLLKSLLLKTNKRKQIRRSKVSKVSTLRMQVPETRKFLFSRLLKVSLETRRRRRTTMMMTMVGLIRTRWSPERSKVWKRCTGKSISKSKILKKQGLPSTRILKSGNSFTSHMSFSPISERETKSS